MEMRAREFHRVINQPAEDLWRKFIKENYSQALIDKPVKVDIRREGGPSTTVEKNATSGLESKVAMYSRLHHDFGNSKIISTSIAGNQLTLILQNDNGPNGNFIFTFEKADRHLIDGLNVQVMMR